MKPRQRKRRTRKNRKKKVESIQNDGQNENNRNQKRKEGNLSMEKIKWKTYYKDSTLNPLHPKPIVEEFNYVKES